MNYYFKLQFNRAVRKSIDFGIHPVLSIGITIVVFLVLSIYVLGRMQYADWVYGVIAVTLLVRLSSKERNEQLKLIFSWTRYRQVRLIENGLLVIPFFLFLIFYGYFTTAILLFIGSCLLAVFGKFKSLNFSVYTPFKKMPFEFIVGFRRSYGVVLFIYFLTFKSVEVENFNLGLFAFGFIFLVSMSFYLSPEKEYFVWVFALNSKQFLRHKILYGFIGSTVLSIPVLVMLMIFFPENFLMIVMILFLGYALLSAVVLGKYATYPKEISLVQAVLLGMSLWFPPMLLGVIPFFYMQSKRQLELILHDKNSRFK